VNPHGQGGRWNGRFGYTGEGAVDSMWCKLQGEMGPTPEVVDDGTSWLPEEEFRKHFTRVDISKSAVYGQQRPQCARQIAGYINRRHCGGPPKWWQNPRYTLKLKDTSHLTITLNAPNTKVLGLDELHVVEMGFRVVMEVIFDGDDAGTEAFLDAKDPAKQQAKVSSALVWDAISHIEEDWVDRTQILVADSDLAFVVAHVPAQTGRQVSTSVTLASSITIKEPLQTISGCIGHNSEQRFRDVEYPLVYYIVPYTKSYQDESKAQDLPYYIDVFSGAEFELGAETRGVQARYHRHLKEEYDHLWRCPLRHQAHADADTLLDGTVLGCNSTDCTQGYWKQDDFVQERS